MDVKLTVVITDSEKQFSQVGRHKIWGRDLLRARSILRRNIRRIFSGHSSGVPTFRNIRPFICPHEVSLPILLPRKSKEESGLNSVILIATIAIGIILAIFLPQARPGGVFPRGYVSKACRHERYGCLLCISILAKRTNRKQKREIRKLRQCRLIYLMRWR